MQKIKFKICLVQKKGVLVLRLLVYNLRKNGGKDQESIQSSTTPDPGYHMRK